MTQVPWIYTTDAGDRFRFVLGVKGKNMLAIIGANPSTAQPGKPDRTVAKMQKIALQHGYDGWLLCNLWPERETHPDKLRKRMLREIHKKNLHYMQAAFRKYPVNGIWAAWGNIIEKRPYLLRCLFDITEMESCQNTPWLQLGTPTIPGHPRHPLYQSDYAALIPFDIKAYAMHHRRQFSKRE